MAGTFLNGILYTGETGYKRRQSREKSSERISDMLEYLRLVRGRLTTGTPPRIKSESIDYTKVAIEPGDDDPKPFFIPNIGS